ncbi:hypothetical protein [Sinomicrobium sp. M5D2P9]
MNTYSKKELEEANIAIASLIRKCEKAKTTLKENPSQQTLLERRIAALRISMGLIEKELSEVTKNAR